MECSEKHVRIYFLVSISYLIPKNPWRVTSSRSDTKWEVAYLSRTCENIESLISKHGFEVAFRRHAKTDVSLRLFNVVFAVSTLHTFSSAHVFEWRKNVIGFGIKKGIFRKVIAGLEKKLYNLLQEHYVVEAITYEYAASRSFGFNVFLTGQLDVEHVISDHDIRAAGSVTGAINEFNNRVIRLAEGSGCIATPQNIAKRPKNNIYQYHLSAEKCFSFGERAIFGDFCDLPKLVKKSHVETMDITLDEQVLIDLGSSEEELLRNEFDTFIPDARVEALSFYVSHYDEDFIDYDDDLRAN